MAAYWLRAVRFTVGNCYGYLWNPHITERTVPKGGSNDCSGVSDCMHLRGFASGILVSWLEDFVGIIGCLAWSELDFVVGSSE